VKAELEFLRGQTVTCAVSGGADSVTLLHLLWSARQELELNLYAAHFNHGLRQTADRDEQFVRRLCTWLQIPLATGSGDVKALAEREGLSVEEAARRLRYEFLLQQPGLIAVAHNADDQVETVLLNLLRGTGLKGLCAMERQSGRIVRPLLEISRQQIEAYLLANGLDHCEDETNTEDDALRNRLRHHVVPLLKAENPSLTKTVGRMTELLRRDERYLQEQTDALLLKAQVQGGYDCRVLRHSPLCQRAVRSLLTIEKPAMHHVQAVCDLMKDLRGSAEVQLPGMRVVRQYHVLSFSAPSYETPEAVSVSCEKEGSLVWGNWEISWQARPCGADTLCIRSRCTADAIRLPGGSKSIKKLFIDKKIPAAVRDSLPIVICGGQVVAVADLVCRAEGITIKERKR